MNKKYDIPGLFTVESENTSMDKESLKAQKQWEKDGTVTEKYLERTLGDISKGILANSPRTNKETKTSQRKARTS